MEKLIIILALCLTLIIVTTGCSEVEPGPSAGSMKIDVSHTPVHFYYSDFFSKNNKQQIILAFWDNDSEYPLESSSGSGSDSTTLECRLTKSDPGKLLKLKCVGKFDSKSGKWEININGEKFDVSNGRLFLINTFAIPLKVIQVNEQFNLPPFNDLSCLDLPFTKKGIAISFSSCEKKFEYLAKNNKIVAAFLADGRRSGANTEREQIIKNLAKGWKKYLGDMDFSNRFLFRRMLHLYPQSLEEFEKFENIKLSKGTILDHNKWLRRHFKGQLRKKLQKSLPSKYYLRKNKYDKSLLFYQTEINGLKITLMENYTVSLITFKPNNFDLAKGIKRNYLASVFSSWINIDAAIIPELLTKPLYRKGLIFANNKEQKNLSFMRGWEDDILCFLTEKGVSLLLFKARRGRALRGISTMPDWLDKGKGLFDEKSSKKEKVNFLRDHGAKRAPGRPKINLKI